MTKITLFLHFWTLFLYFETNINEGQIYHNGTIEAVASDAICNTSTLIATLDGQGIELPYDFRSLEMEPGNHQLVLTASDMIGNVTSKIVNFVTPEENAAINGDITPVSGTTVNGDPTFKVTVSDSTDDLMQVAFKRGERYLLGDSNIVLKRSALVYFIQNIPIILPVIILMMAFFFYT